MIFQDLGNMVFRAVFCPGFIDFMLKDKSFLDLFTPTYYEKNEKIISIIKKVKIKKIFCVICEKF